MSKSGDISDLASGDDDSGDGDGGVEEEVEMMEYVFRVRREVLWN